MQKKLKAAILGFGGMGHCHGAQYANLANVELVALCDINPEQLKKIGETINLGDTGNMDLGGLRTYLSFEELLKGEPDLDMLDICLPSDLHCEYACKAMKAGLHVLCEKPMALTVRDCEKMIRTSGKTGKKLMVAQVVRFDERFQQIRKAYESGKYGKLLRLVMHRVGSLPAKPWFRDVARSGGALMDLHLHDLDFLLSLLGKPESLVAFGSGFYSGGIDDCLVNYIYPDGVTASSESGWTRSAFCASASAIFEKGTIEVLPDKVVLYQVDKPVKELKCKDVSPYGLEIDYFASCIRKNVEPERCSIQSTRDTIAILHQELRSIATVKRIAIPR